MNSPVYTEKAECQDCYKCIRECPVKAIRVENARAHIVYDNCVLCGHCVDCCPVNAKKVRNDICTVQKLLESGKKVIVSLAPSYAGEFPGIPLEQIAGAICALGFGGVSETAHGAHEVNHWIAHEYKKGGAPKVWISSACPTAVELIRKYYPQSAPRLTGVFSPLLAHAKLLRTLYGNDIGIVFVGPCIAKKREADHHPELLDAALTFEDLREWFKKAGIDPESCQTTSKAIPAPAGDTRLYPLEGGMISTLKPRCPEVEFISISGISAIRSALEDLETLNPERPVFLELLACEGGCVAGPKIHRGNPSVRRQLEVRSNALQHNTPAEWPEADLADRSKAEPVSLPVFDEIRIRSALARIGKTKPEDELNCGGCGYDSCRDFALALLESNAEESMCVSYMRKLAQKKANALIKTIPSGVVIVKDSLDIVECNERFAKIAGKDAMLVYDAKPGLEGVNLKELFPDLAPLFRTVLETGREITDFDLKTGGNVIRLTVFEIEKGRSAGAILEDITLPTVRKEEIIASAKKVIRKNLATVQKIAYLIGENAAETEMTLEEIIASFGTENREGKNEH